MVAELANTDEFSNLVRQMNSIAESVMGRHYFGFSPTDAWRPSVNLYETDAAFLICVDLAGMDQKEMDVKVENDNVIIRGRRQSPVPPDGAKAVAVHLMEIDHGTFCRTVDIPANVDATKISANYREGLLWVMLPKRG
jgi:HSP20 family protein